MDTEATLERLLTVYAWGLVCVLLLFLYGIARFYQRTSRERSYYWLFLIPLGLFAGAAGRYAWTGTVAGDPLGDGLLFFAGVCLLAIGAFLNRLMMGRRRKP